jgi:chromosomal replication initiator protein
MIADIQLPDLDMREAILLSKIRRQSIDIPGEVVRYLAQNVSSSIRDLEGSLVRLVTQSKINHTTLSLELARSFIDKKSRPLAKVSPKEVLEIICNYFDLKQSELKSSSRVAKLVLPRQITMYLLRKDLQLQLEAIAEFLGRKDHTTVIHGVEKIEGNVEKSELLRGQLADIRAKLYN